MSVSMFKANTAVDAGAVQVDATVTLSVDRVVFTRNAAQHSGGALRFVGVPGTGTGSEGGVSWRNVAVLDNEAVSGGGIFWVLPLPYDVMAPPLPHVVGCSGCTWRNTGGNVSSTAVRAKLLPLAQPVQSVLVSSGMPVAEYERNADLRPRVGLLDLYGQPARLDNATACVVEMISTTDAAASVAPLALHANQGVVASDTLVFRGTAGTNITTAVNCTLTSPLSGSVVSSVSLDSVIDSCRPGWDLTTSKVCRRCLSGWYSPDGKLCMPCPEGGACAETIGDRANEVSW